MTRFQLVDSEIDLQNRRLVILKGISQDLYDSEIADQLGVNRWMVLKDVRLMQQHRDPGLMEAKRARDAIRTEKNERLNAEKSHFKKEAMFLSMTGMTLQEKSFRNMIDFYKPELMEIMKAGDQSYAIMALSKADRRIMLHNGILNGRRGAHKSWSVTTRAEEYLTIAIM